MSRGWAAHDFYGILEVAPDVDAAEIKHAYRRLAQQHHPDANPDDPLAEERFKAIAVAYGVLSDPIQRDLYDRMQIDKTAPKAGADGVEDEERFSASVAGAVLGRHIITSATLPLEQAARGASVVVTLDDGSRITVKLPAGVDDGDIVRIEGQGRRPEDRGAPGDLIVIIHVPRHETFERDGHHLTTRVPVALSDAAMGADVLVPTLTGPVTITIPPGTTIGSRFKIEGRGIITPDGRAGDLFVILEPHSNDTMRPDATRGSFAGLVEALEGQMEIIPTVGHPYDPAVHEAVRVAPGGHGSLVVTGEVRRGYRIRGQVIRPALVTVAYSQVGPSLESPIDEGDPL